MTRLRIVHRTGFSYEHPATASYNEARMLPATNAHQLVLSAQLDVSPQANQQSYVDYWGAQVRMFEVLHAHNELSVTATSVVEVRPQPEDSTDIGWTELEALAAGSAELAEQMPQTRVTDPPAELVRFAKKLVKEGVSPRGVAVAVCKQVFEHMDYVQGATGVHSTGAEAWMAGQGVCQDFAHMTIGTLRAVGIPARYVSGYLHPKRDAGIGVSVVGESHAWVEWFTGSWQGFDPTNDLPIGDLHVYVSRGRDYFDVAPLKGVYAGQSTSNVFVTVEITREA